MCSDAMVALSDGCKLHFFKVFCQKKFVLSYLQDLLIKIIQKVCLLIKALNGLKQAPRAWYQRIHMFFDHCSYHYSRADSNQYILYVDDAIAVLIILYVDDLIITGSLPLLIEKVNFETSVVNSV